MPVEPPSVLIDIIYEDKLIFAHEHIFAVVIHLLNEVYALTHVEFSDNFQTFVHLNIALAGDCFPLNYRIFIQLNPKFIKIEEFLDFPNSYFFVLR